MACAKNCSARSSCTGSISVSAARASDSRSSPLAFGAFHLDQGYDVALAICCLGLFWGLAYIRRRSAILPMVNHASFNATQVIQIMLARALNA